MDLYIPYNKDILLAVISVLNDVEKNIGLKVSYNKTTIYQIGSLSSSCAKLYTPKPMVWANDYVNTLGIDLRHTNLERNFDQTIQKMQSIINNWYYCSLTIIGKVMIVNALFASLFRWFKFTLKPPYSITHSKLRLAIWDTSFWTFWLKFGHKTP